MPVAYFLTQALVERESAGFGACIVCHLADGNEAGHAGNSDHMAVVLLDHARQELLDSEKVRNSVHLEGLPDEVLRFAENGPRVRHAGVVYEHRRISMLAADQLGDLPDAC